MTGAATAIEAAPLAEGTLPLRIRLWAGSWLARRLGADTELRAVHELLDRAAEA